MLKVIIVKGLPGSGKSYWAKNQIKKYPGRYKRINKDDLRAMFDNGKWSKDNEKFVLKIRDHIILEALETGKHIIVDDTNLSLTHEKRIRQITKGKAEVEIKDFTDVKLETCIKRDLQRFNSVGSEVIIKMWNDFLKPKSSEIKFDTNLPSCIICDIDGTLAKMCNRSPFDWNKIYDDFVNKAVQQILWSFTTHKDNAVKIIIVTGRDGSCINMTKKWLKDHNIIYDKIYIRPEGNTEDDRIIKERIYDEHIKGKYNVLFVLDDRPKIIRHWKNLGLFVLDCNQADSRIDY